jgi:hypothetical protein
MARHARYRTVRDGEGRWRVWDRQLWCYVGETNSFDRSRIGPIVDILNANVRVRNEQIKSDVL